REGAASGYELAALVGMIAPNGEVRLLSRAVARHVAPALKFPEHDPPRSLLVVTESGGEPRFQHIEVF
ncbi:MAG: hypothetical protein M3020_28355, partial [Myxococcota bacterium]|nr:hypothetical protein [Myxococcota bacterium]